MLLNSVIQTKQTEVLLVHVCLHMRERGRDEAVYTPGLSSFRGLRNLRMEIL